MRASRIAIIVIILLLLIGGSAYALFLSQTTSLALPITSGPGTEPSTQCPSNQYAYNETSSGDFTCSQVGYNQLDNFPLACSSNQYFTNISYPSTCKPIAQDYRLGLVGYWSLDLVSGTSISDLSGYSNTGTTHNSPLTISGRIENGLNFSMSKSQYVDIPYNSILSNMTTITFNAFIKLASLPTLGNDFFILGQQNNYEYRMLIQHSGAIFCQFTMSGTHQTLAGNAQIGTNDWNYISCVFNGSKMLDYINGTLDNSVVQTGSLGVVTASVFGIGADNLDSAFYTNGIIDECRIYNFALSAQQEANLYQYYENILNGV